MNTKSTIWVDQIRAHLQLLDTVCGHCPRGEYLQPKDLNEILELFEESKGKFILMCELHGFNITKKS